MLWVTLCQTSWWKKVCLASCSDHQLEGFKWEGIVFDIKTMRTEERVVSPFTSSGCGRPTTSSSRPEQLLSESLLERIGKTRQTSQRVLACGQWFLPKIHWDPNLCFSLQAAACAEDGIFCPTPPSYLPTRVIFSLFVTFCFT